MAVGRVNSDPLIAELFPLPDFPEPAGITRAGHFILLQHLASALTQLDAMGNLQSAIAESWKINKDHTEFIFEIRKGIMFSDGSELLAQDVLDSVQRQIDFQNAVHYDFKRIKDVRLISKYVIAFHLRNPDPHFILEVAKPEFAILSKEDQKAPLNGCTFKISSGPYTLNELSNGVARMTENKNYYQNSPGAPKLLTFKSSPIGQQVQDIKTGKIAFLVPTDAMNVDMHKAILATGKIEATIPHVGFTYWLRLNPNSSNLSNLETRRWLQKLLNPQQFDLSAYAPFWEPSLQLYLPEGSGRLTESETKAFWERTMQVSKPKNLPKKLKVIRPDFPLKEFEAVLTRLHDNGIATEIIDYKDDQELKKVIATGAFDLGVSSNDFSSIELDENIEVAFNKNRPYISIEHSSPIHKLLLEMASEGSPEKLAVIYHSIASELLESAYVIPMVHNRVVFYHQKSLDIARWSQLYPEISFFKSIVHSE